MKSSWLRWINAGVVVVSVGLVTAACEDKQELPTNAAVTAVSVQEIILNPKSVTPGDTLLLTAIITSSAPNEGEFPTITWSATGGAFIENGKLNVRWVAPAASQLFQITCKAQNSTGNPSQRSTDVFVSSPQPLVNSQAGETRLMPNGTDFFYFRTPNITNGAEVYRRLGGAVSDVVPGSQLGQTPRISDTQANAAYSVQITRGGVVDQEINVFINDLVAGNSTQLTTDRSVAGSIRKYQFKFPEFSPNGALLAFQAMRPSNVVGGVDTFDVYVYDIAAMDTTIVTQTHGITTKRNNFFPTFSSDNSWLTFYADRSGPNIWELYGLPVVGNTVTTDSSATVRLTTTGGLLAGTPLNLKRPRMAWNPSASSPTMAMIGDDGVLRLITTNATGATSVVVTGIDVSSNQKVQQFGWSPDGQRLHVTTFSELYLVSPGGVATEIYRPLAGDALRDVSWFPDGNWLVYRIVRGADAWFELLDIGAGILTRPAQITAADASAGIGNYGAMNLGSAVNGANMVYLIRWPDGAATPAITGVDLSGIVSSTP